MQHKNYCQQSFGIGTTEERMASLTFRVVRIVRDEYRPIEIHVLRFRLRHAVPRPALLVVAPIPVESSKARGQHLEIGHRSSIWSPSTFRQIVSVRVAQVPDDGHAAHWLARALAGVLMCTA